MSPIKAFLQYLHFIYKMRRRVTPKLTFPLQPQEFSRAGEVQAIYVLPGGRGGESVLPITQSLFNLLIWLNVGSDPARQNPRPVVKFGCVCVVRTWSPHNFTYIYTFYYDMVTPNIHTDLK